jgi:integrase
MAAGLFLLVAPSGVKSWQYRYKLDGKGQTATLGKHPRMSLAEARVAAIKARDMAANGEHLTTAKRLARAQRATDRSATFEKLASDWIAIEARRAKWTADYRQEVTASIRNHLSGLNALPVAAISATIVAPALRKVERSAPDMGTKVLQRLRAILDHAVEERLIHGNPLPASRRRKRNTRSHYPAVVDRDGVGAILSVSDKAEVSRGVRRAHLMLAVLTQRISETVGATWSEFDLSSGTWAIPRNRMKRKEPERGAHLVPIPPQLLAQMREWRRADGENAEFVCPAPGGERPITREAVEKFYRRTLKLTGKHSPHSWRSVIKTWVENAEKSTDAVEAQLDHIIGGKIAASYDRANRLAVRRELIAWYEGELIAARDGAT